MNVHEYPLNLSLGLLPIKQHGILGIFILLGKLAGKHEYVCNVHLSKMSPFWLK